jgi:hypothetical protein
MKRPRYSAPLTRPSPQSGDNFKQPIKPTAIPLARLRLTSCSTECPLTVRTHKERGGTLNHMNFQKTEITARFRNSAVEARPYTGGTERRVSGDGPRLPIGGAHELGQKREQAPALQSRWAAELRCCCFVGPTLASGGQAIGDSEPDGLKARPYRAERPAQARLKIKNAAESCRAVDTIIHESTIAHPGRIASEILRILWDEFLRQPGADLRDDAIRRGDGQDRAFGLIIGFRRALISSRRFRRLPQGRYALRGG